MHLSRVQKGIICSMTLAGIGVMTTAALAEDLGLRKKEEEEEQEKEQENGLPSALEIDLELPSLTLPKSTGELVNMWASGYEQVKEPLAGVFRMAGQMLVAPIAMLVIDASYAKYIEYTESTSKVGGTAI